MVKLCLPRHINLTNNKCVFGYTPYHDKCLPIPTCNIRVDPKTSDLSGSLLSKTKIECTMNWKNVDNAHDQLLKDCKSVVCQFQKPLL